jgi:hypothetical protein
MLIYVRQLLWKLTHKPNHLLNQRKTLFTFIKHCKLFGMNNRVLSINYKYEILIQSCKSIRETNLTDKLLLSMTDMPLITMLKSKEDMISLYCITQETLKSGHE